MPFLQFEYKNYFSILMIYTYRRQSNCHFGKLLQIKSKKEAFFFSSHQLLKFATVTNLV